ncbi:hypothetical protein PR202_ga20866 [Eleusine coracana subsp. coracana]|uniref:Uncharacterized protein n=1 Tax=Eleusine coracana subsp. coracana TaxID=191504 RepID=A0AAV5CY77_ELECO|nr:hypothetical protein QOZ80_8AG0629330 [Eleusine coracana subsp. coracana]GJN03422.1 hypothetical protein PR202_ga20866 [Eleusine coracana subsp. coracana]
MPSTTSSIDSGKPLRSASAIVAGTESGQHLLKIAGFSRITKDVVPTGSDIKSRSFRVGGHSWHIRYYPNGVDSSWSDYISIYLQLDHCTVPKGVTAQFRFDLLDHEGKPVPQYTTPSFERVFRDLGWGVAAFIRRDELERSVYLRDDGFTIRCEFTVMTEIHTKDIDVATPHKPPAVVVPPPPPDLHHHLGGLLSSGEAADVTFEVDGKTFQAHRCVLAARSSVLRSELAGLQDSNKERAATGAGAIVRIEDMEAQDFEAFLHYVYTDTLPEMKKGTDAAAMLPDLVAAANKYKMERLRLVCEDKMCEFVNARTVAAMLTFAGEHQCHGLKEACLQFLEDPGNVREVVKVNGLEHLSPSALKDLIAKLVAGLQLSNAT